VLALRCFGIELIRFLGRMTLCLLLAASWGEGIGWSASEISSAVNSDAAPLLLRVELPDKPIRSTSWTLVGVCAVDADISVRLPARNQEVPIERRGEKWLAYLEDLPEGETKIEITLVSAGGRSKELQVSLEVDRDPPTITITSPESQIHYPDIPPLEFSTEAETVHFILDDRPVSDMETTWASLPDGEHRLVVAALDAAGNLAREEVSFTLDRTPPALFAAVVPPVVNRSILVISGLREPETMITVQAPSAVTVSEPTYPGNDEWQYALSGLTERDYRVTVTGTDPAGNTSHETIAFSVDMTPPPLLVVSPEDTAYNDQFVPFAATGFGARSLVLLNGKKIDIQSPGRLGPLVDGEHVLLVRSRDQVGNVATVRRVFVVDTSPPLARLLEPRDGDTTDLTPTVRFQAGEGSVMLYLDGRPVYVPSGDPLPALEEGDHLLRLHVTDSAGNLGSDWVSFYASGGAPRVSILSPPDGVVFDQTPEVRFDVARGEVSVLLDEKPLDLESGDFLPPQSIGVHRLRVFAVDSEGRVGSAESRFEVQDRRLKAPGHLLSRPLARYREFSVNMTPTRFEPAGAVDVRLFVRGLQQFGEMVYLEQWSDLNHNGQVDMGEPLLRQMRLQDGVSSKGGRVPADEDGEEDGTISSRLFFSDDHGSLWQPGHYVLLVMSEFDIEEIPFQIMNPGP